MPLSARTWTWDGPSKSPRSSSGASADAPPGRFATRIVSRGATPSLHVAYQSAKIKQYFKEERALRTETTINDTRDFGLGRRLHNLPDLRAIGCAANRRVLEAERISQDCRLAEGVFDHICRPVIVDGQRAAALPFGNLRVMALFQALCLFIFLPEGVRHAPLRTQVAQLPGQPPEQYTPGRMTYDLRRLRLHGLIEKVAPYPSLSPDPARAAGLAVLHQARRAHPASRCGEWPTRRGSGSCVVVA